MIDEKELKARLQEIAADNYQAPTRPEIYPLILAMGTYIGSIDPELRDELIFTTMTTWIGRDVFEPNDLNEILKVVLNEQHLFWGLGEEGTDTVFTRTFSMLVVSVVLNAHLRHPFLADNELQVIKKKILRYLSKERDFRGFVPGKGWAHAAAHTADTLSELLQCPSLEKSDLQELFAAIKGLVQNSETVYTWEEDERLVTALLSGWQREEISPEEAANWLERLAPGEGEELPFPAGYRRFVNSKQFLRSLYFRTEPRNLPEYITSTIRRVLSTFNRYE